MKKISVSLWLMLSGLALTAVGMACSQHTAVLEKAVRICLECVGIG